MHSLVDSIEDLFYNGLKRSLQTPIHPNVTGEILNLGSGISPILGAVNLDLPDWEAPWLLEHKDESVSVIHAYHFLEHLDGDNVKLMIAETYRVLKCFGVFNYCVPYAMSPIAYMDVDHRTFWTEETMRTLIESRGYDSAAVDGFRIRTQFIAGLNSQNLAVFGQLVKES